MKNYYLVKIQWKINNISSMGCNYSFRKKKLTLKGLQNNLQIDADLQQSSNYAVQVPISKQPSFINSRIQKSKYNLSGLQSKQSQQYELRSSNQMNMKKNKVMQLFQDLSKFQGQIINEFTLFGVFSFNNGNKYQGELINSNIQGEGKFIFASGNIYQGIWQDGSLIQCKKIIYSDGNIYQGQLINFKKNGYGKFKWANGNIYQGHFQDGFLDGQGVFQNQDEIIQGRWCRGVLIKIYQKLKKQKQAAI